MAKSKVTSEQGADEAPDVMVTVKVARGRVQTVDGVYDIGQMLEVTQADADTMLKLGIVVMPDQPVAGVLSPDGPQVTSDAPGSVTLGLSGD